MSIVALGLSHHTAPVTVRERFAFAEGTLADTTRRLRETGQDRNTLVCFISDNGGPTMPGVTVNASRNDPFRGSKRTTLEGGIHVPFLVAWPGRLTPGVYAQPVIQLDLTATALTAAGLNPAADAKLEGVPTLMPAGSAQPPAPPPAPPAPAPPAPAPPAPVAAEEAFACGSLSTAELQAGTARLAAVAPTTCRKRLRFSFIVYLSSKKSRDELKLTARRG